VYPRIVTAAQARVAGVAGGWDEFLVIRQKLHHFVAGWW